jgi:hypothetical protein
MNGVRCPNCEATIPPQEVAGGWCETCGKKIPPWAAAQAEGAGEPVGAVPPEATPARNGRSWSVLGFLLILLCTTVGAGIAIALAGGRADGAAPGSAAGAGLGLGLARAWGLWGRKK